MNNHEWKHREWERDSRISEARRLDWLGESWLGRVADFLSVADVADGRLRHITDLTSYEAHGARQIIAECQQKRITERKAAA